MLFPFPTMPTSAGPPTQFMITMRKWMLLMLILQSLVCILRFVLMDIWEGFIMAIIIGFGWYAWYQGMNITFICYWGLIGFIHGIFDLVRLIDFEVKSRHPMFVKQASVMYNLHALARLLEPIVMLLGALMAWYLYRYDLPDPIYEQISSSDWQEPPNSRTPLGGGQRLGGGGGRTLGSSTTSFSTFTGQGHRLGS
mmetsp:Transcript_71789/g.166050  ORF Transcript_71789/g.166050 Transcript_71789/m.166050 type:complete len:196 (+) Transcript_71789:88-675(+)